MSPRISWIVPRTVTDEDEVRVTAAGSVSPCIAYAARAFNEMNKSELVCKGTGNPLSKVVRWSSGGLHASRGGTEPGATS